MTDPADGTAGTPAAGEEPPAGPGPTRHLLLGSEAATAARRARAELKRGLAFSGDALRRAVDACQGEDGAPLRRMPVVELLAAMPGVGPRRAEELAVLAGVAPGKRLAGLGRVQIDTLARIIDERAARRSRRGS